MRFLVKLMMIFLVESSWGHFQENFAKRSERENKMPQEVQERLRTPPKLNLKQSLAMNQVVNFYTLKEASSELCRNHSMEFSAGLRSFEPWALKMFDASSKMQSGILAGNLFNFGSFDQCIAVQAETAYGPLKGKHCTLKLRPDTALLKKILSYNNISEKRWDQVKIFVENATLDWSICVPDSCISSDVLPHFQMLMETLTEGLNLTVNLKEMNCLMEVSAERFSFFELAVIFGMLAYVGFIAILTAIDLNAPSRESKSNQLLSIFSASRNAIKVFARSAKARPDLDCVHGIRFISTCYVIIGHRYLMMMFFPVINSLQIINWTSYYRSTAITGGTLCVDTFFMISGMLVTIGFFEQASKGKVNWFLFYFYRYIRITPPLAIVILWYCTLMHHFGSGPLWNDMLDIIQKPCQQYWWAAVLHIQNYVHPYPLCLTQIWYLTCDMQYYFLSPIILIPFRNDQVLGSINFALLFSLSVAVNFYLAWAHKYNGGVPVTNELFATEYFQHHYIAPHVRSSTYILGLGFGMLIYNQKGKEWNVNTAFVVAGWLVCAATMLASMLGCHVFFVEEHDYNRLESSIYLAASRSAWTLGIGWMVWACINGYGGPINFILSLHIFRVFGKISYGIYLLHMGMQYMISAAARTPHYFSDLASMYAAVSDLFIMVFCGFAFTILFESPLVQMLSLLARKGNMKRTVEVKPLNRH
ncbi:nose resistant to fluoxetine protein 6 isoform X2 [Dendroctonus ponderosae]|uniref:nose resistant to fluoxetine protein 6 isoform X2 n=1 Tax=Dendroctonus ponderosae TaxID=77166 RepID=UPI002036512B|nr:nose resistant to fluoxetine protein 6 isoform X2 [Dendroctonus ponderosae]